MITLATENATLTGLPSTHSGSLLRSVCKNREATPRPSFVAAFQSVTCVGSAIVRLVSRSSSRCVSMLIIQAQGLSVILTLAHGGTQQIWISWWRILDGFRRIWSNRLSPIRVNNTKNNQIYLLEDFVPPASFPGARSWASNAEETETGVELDWLAESLADLGRLIRSLKSFFTLPPFFFDFIAAVDEGWSAMVIRDLERGMGPIGVENNSTTHLGPVVSLSSDVFHYFSGIQHTHTYTHTSLQSKPHNILNQILHRLGINPRLNHAQYFQYNCYLIP